MISRNFYFYLALIAVFAAGCGSGGDEITKPSVQGPANQLFDQAKSAYNKEDWLEAIRLFEQVRIEAPASPIAGEATYLEAMSRYNQEMFAGSAVDFRAVRRNYPNSPYAVRAQYMVGESYYQISPRPELDQSYTLLAIGEYQSFMRAYPNAPLSLLDSAQKRIMELRTKLSLKYLLNAQLYDKLEDPKSALVYYQRVLNDYYDTPQAPEAELRVAEISYDRHKVDDARKAIVSFDEKYLQSATPEERQRALTLHAKLQTS